MNTHRRRQRAILCSFLLTFYLLLFTFSAPLFAGAIKSWGETAFDSSDFVGSQFIVIAAGENHSLALKSDGSVVAWGRNDYGQATPPVGNNFIAISAGGYHSIALKADSSIVCWGDNSYGQATPPEGNDFIAIAAGSSHSLALKSDGSIVAWGANWYGEATPPTDNNFIAVSAGLYYSLALKSDGSIVAWGDNSYGQITPPEGNDFMDVSAGWYHALALKSDGSTVGWGRNGAGQATPPEGNNFTAISAGEEYSLAVKSDGSIVAWGDNSFGKATPPQADDFIAVAAGGNHSLALKSDGSFAGWGSNDFAQSNPPVGNNFIAISAGERYSLALKSNGSIVAWGNNDYGRATPPDVNNFFAIAAGHFHSLAVKANGLIAGWGRNDYGQANPYGGNKFISVSAGGFHSLALRSNGSMAAWGRNNDGQGMPLTGNNFIAIAAGYWHNVALKSDGSTTAWGWNGDGQATPPGGNDFIAISAGGWHSLALKSNGSIIGWGWNEYGQATPPAGNDFIAIAAGGYHSLAIKSDGSIVGWGRNNSGQATPPAGNNFIAVSAGHYHSLALYMSKTGDLNGDAFVDFIDFSKFADDWLLAPDPCDPNSGDIVKDGNINLFDLTQLVSNWLTCFVTNASIPVPAGKSVNVDINVILQWSAGLNAESHNVYFGTDFNEVQNAAISDSNVFMGNQTSISWDTNNYDVNGLEYSVTYYWRIDEAAGCTAKGNVWKFTTMPPPPGQAANPIPIDGANDINLTADLVWTAGNGALSHDVYFGTTNPPPFKINKTSTTYDPGILDTNTTYYWRIDEKNGNITIGDVWSFKTIIQLPGQAGNPTPIDGANNVVVSTVLIWTAGELATSHDVYFGTTNPPSFISNHTSTTYDTGTMDTNTTYYWRIDERNLSGMTQGILWSFTTNLVSDVNDANLIAWWSFYERTGSIAHDSKGVNNGNIYGATWTTGLFGGALSFDGTNDYVDCGSGPSNYDNVSVAVWMKTSSTGILVSNRYNSSSYGTWYTLSSTNIEIGDDSQGGYRNISFNSTTLNGLWHHIVYTKDGLNHAIYVDGSLDQQFTSNADISWFVPLYIGKRGTWVSDSDQFNGVIDDVRIYNRALAADEVALLFQQGQ